MKKLVSRIYACTHALPAVPSGAMLAWRIGSDSGKRVVELVSSSQVIGRLEDRYVSALRQAQETHQVHITLARLRKGLRCAVVRFYPRNRPLSKNVAPSQQRLPYVD